MAIKWLITGGCGFIGRNLVKNLVEQGTHSITIVDNLSAGTRDDLKKVCDFRETKADRLRRDATRVDLVIGDIIDDELALGLCSNTDIIVHLAANTGVAPSVSNPRKDCISNVIGTFNYLEGARVNGVKRFIFASSGAPIGECTPPIHEELPAHPVSPYGASKLAGEGYCSAYFKSYGIETIALRFGNVYGPFSSHKDSVVAKFIKRILSHKTLEIYGDGNQTRDFIYITDLVSAIFSAALFSGIGGETLQIATAKETTILELVEALEAVVELEYPDIEVSYVCSEPRIGDVKRNYSDTAKAQKLIGWQAKTGLRDGLKKTINWFFHQVNSDA